MQLFRFSKLRLSNFSTYVSVIPLDIYTGRNEVSRNIFCRVFKVITGEF